MLKKIFTILLIIFPILYMYQTPILTLTVADVLLIILIPFLLIDMARKKIKISIYKPLGIVVLYIILQTLIIILLSNDSNINSIIFSICRLLLYYTVLTVFTKTYFDIEFGIKIYKKVAIFVCCFLFLQIICEKLFGFYIPGTIPGLPVSEALTEYNEQKSAGNPARLRSLFAEPAHFSTYVSLIFAIDLLKENKINKRIIIYTLGLLLSGSSTGIFMVAIIYAIYFIKNMKSFSKRTIINITVVMALIAIILPMYMQTESFKIFFERTFVNENSSIDGRFENYGMVLEETNTINLIFGRGTFAEIDGYIPALPRIYFYYGIIGMIYFIIRSARNFIKLKGTQFASWLVLFILIFPTELIFGYLIMVYMPFIIKGENERKSGNIDSIEGSTKIIY